MTSLPNPRVDRAGDVCRRTVTAAVHEPDADHVVRRHGRRRHEARVGADGGGLATSFMMELLVPPAIYLLWKWNAEVKDGSFGAPEALEPAEPPKPALELR